MLTPQIAVKVDELCTRLKQRRLDGSLAAAKSTAELLRQLVTSFRGNDPRDLMEEVKQVGVKLQAARASGELIAMDESINLTRAL